MSAEEATVNPDGSATFEEPPVTDDAGAGAGAGGAGAGADEPPIVDEEKVEEIAQGIDPAVYLLIAVVIFALYYFFVYRKKKNDSDSFFAELDGDKFNLKLPAEVDEYYTIKERVEAAGWQPGQGAGQQAGGPQQNAAKILAQALMKRAIADIPIVTHIQKESAGMNKLYSQSMCSVNQWRSYQAAEAMVSAEVEDVRAEADQLEPGWSNVIWRQAMQYHNVLKQKHEAETKAVEEQAKKRKEVEKAVAAAKANDPEYKAKMAEKAAQELIKAEEREKQSKKAFNNKGGGIKKGFLDGKGKKGKK